MLKSNEYWKRRMELLEEIQMKKGEQYLKDLDDQYTKVTKNIERELSVWYRRFAANNEITMTEARKLLNSKELKEFKWDVNEYIKFGKENALDQKWMKQLENASVRVHVSRLEALKLQLQQQVEVLYGNHVDGIDDLLRKIYKDGYYHTAWEVQKGFNIGWDLYSINDNQLNKILSRPWTIDKRTFSDRLWINKQQLIGNLQTHLTQSVITGKAPDEVIKRLSAQFKTDRNKAGRLVMTESAAFASMAQKDAFNDLDVERFEIVATLDNHTSEVCQDLDGHVFDMKDFEVGATAPPFHPWCRTTTIPYFDDEFSLGGERAARSADGKTYYVPSDMKYHDWYEKFVNNKDNGIIKVNKSKLDYPNIKTLTEAENWAKIHLGVEKASYKDINVDVANYINKSMYEIYTDYPLLNGFVKEINTDGRIKATAVANISFKDGKLSTELKVSTKDLSDIKSIDKMIKDCVSSKWWTRKDGVKGIIKHEMGHMVEYALTLKKHNIIDSNSKLIDLDNIHKGFNAIRNGEISQEIKLKALSNLGLVNTKKEIINNLSEYACYNSLEFLAEAVSESNPEQLAKEVNRLLIEKIKEVWK